MTGSSPVDRSKLGTKRHILIDKLVIKQTFVSNKPKKGIKQRRWKHNHLCLDRAYQSKAIKREIIKRGYAPHIPYKRKRGQKKEENTNQKRYYHSKNKRWIVNKENKLMMA